MNKKGLFYLLSLLAFLICSCQQKQDEANDGESKLKVVCTIGMIGDIVKEIGGENVEVTTLISEGTDPHVYKHSAKDVKLLLAADVVFYNGLHLEGKMGDILKKVGQKGKPVYAVAEEVIKTDELLKDEEGVDDPHLWMDVSKWNQVAGLVAESLKKELPEHTGELEASHAKYSEQLALTDAYAQTTLATIPEKQRELITAHDAFSYMQSAYGLRVRGIQGISTESETGLKELEELINYIVEKNIPAVFVESSVNDKNVKALIEGAKAKGHTVKIGGTLYSDAMGKTGTYEGTYKGMIDHNVTTITRALGGQADAKGMSGLLSEE